MKMKNKKRDNVDNGKYFIGSIIEQIPLEKYKIFI